MPGGVERGDRRTRTTPSFRDRSRAADERAARRRRASGVVGDLAARRGDRRRHRAARCGSRCAPALGVAWWWTHLVRCPTSTAPVVVRDHEVAPAAPGPRDPRRRAVGRADVRDAVRALDVRARGVRRAARRSRGRRCAARSASAFRSASTSNGRSTADASAALGRRRRRRRCTSSSAVVHGEVLLGRERFELDARGPALARVGRAALRSTGDGGVAARARPRADVHRRRRTRRRLRRAQRRCREPIATVRAETHRRADGLPVAARYVVDDRLEITAEVLGLVAVPLAGPGGATATLARALCRYEVVERGADEPAASEMDGRAGSIPARKSRMHRDSSSRSTPRRRAASRWSRTTSVPRSRAPGSRATGTRTKTGHVLGAGGPRPRGHADRARGDRGREPSTA